MADSYNGLTRAGILVVTTVAGGVLIGILLFFITTLESATLVIVLVGGITGGFLLRAVIRIGHIPWRPVIVLTGIIMGCIMYTSLHYAWYLDFRHDMRQAILEDSPGLSVYSVNAQIDSYMKSEVGTTGFPGYMLLSAKYTVSTWTTLPTIDPQPDPGQTILNWIFELFLIIFIMVGMAWEIMGDYYRKDTGRWMEFTHCGMIAGKNVNSFLALLKEERFEEAARLTDPGYSPKSMGIHLHTGKCHEDALEGILKIEAVQRGSTKKILKIVPLPDEQYEQFIRQLNR